MTPQEEAYYAEIIKRLIAPPGSPTDHPQPSMRDLGGEKGVPRKPGASMFSQAEAAQNASDDQSTANYAELDKAIASAKDPKVKMTLEAEKQRLLQESVTVKPYTGDSGQQGPTVNPAPPGEFDAALPPPQPAPPVIPAPSAPMNGPPAPDPWAIPSGPVPPIAAPQQAPAAPGAPPAVAAQPIAPSAPVAPGPPQAPVAPPVGQPGAIAPPVPPALPMPAAGAQSGQPPPMGVQGPQSAVPPGGMDPWAAAGTQLDPKIAPGAPQTPEERDRRASGWKVFLNKLQTDPNLQAMFLKMGTQMIQPVQPGQTSAGHFGAALQSGVDYAVQGSEMKRKGDLEARRSSREDTALDSDLKSQEQARKTGAAAEGRAAAKFKPEMEALAVKIKSAKTEDEINQYALEAAKFKYSKREEYSKAEMAKLDADTKEALAKSIYYGEFAGRGKTGSTPDQNGAVSALKALKDTITTLQQEQNKANPGKKKSYERIKQEFLESNPGLATQWLKLEAAAKGATMEDSPAATPESDPQKIWTQDAMERYLKDQKIKRDAPGRGSSGSYPGGRIGPRSDN